MDLKWGSNSPEICADVEMGARFGIAMVASAWARIRRQVFVDLGLVVWGDDKNWGRGGVEGHWKGQEGGRREGGGVGQGWQVD